MGSDQITRQRTGQIEIPLGQGIHPPGAYIDGAALGPALAVFLAVRRARRTVRPPITSAVATTAWATTRRVAESKGVSEPAHCYRKGLSL